MAQVYLTQLDPVTLTAGVATPLSAFQIITPSLIITADVDNVGDVYIGDQDSSSAKFVVFLEPGKSVSITGPSTRGITEELNIADICADTQSSGNKVYVGYYSRA